MATEDSSWQHGYKLWILITAVIDYGFMETTAKTCAWIGTKIIKAERTLGRRP